MRVCAGGAAALAATLWLCGCAYVGDPLPPLANIPAAVSDLEAVERASEIVVHFTVPVETTEGVAIRGPLEFELRVGTGTAGGFDAGRWAEGATEISGGKVQEGLATYRIPAAEWTGKTVTVAVRTVGAHGKKSDWSNFVNLRVVPPPEQPRSLKAQATADGVRLTWEGAGGTFRILRRGANQKQFTAVGEQVGQPEWTDADAEFGQSYTYRVQRIVTTAGLPDAESDPSDTVEITPKDEFAPAVPTGLRASPAPASIELSWDRNREPDLAGYRVYRSAGGGAFEKVAELSAIPAWSDQKVEHGKTYRYEVTAVDQNGNESGRSAAVEATL